MPETLPMWKVQTATYKDKLVPSGLVARPAGFADSPDAEVISGGESTKTPDAVAIGRHGCFFMWGFAAPPKYLTEEAKVVLANSIIYTSTLKGERIIARKFDDRGVTSDDVEYTINRATKGAYNTRMNKLRSTYRTRIAAQDKVKAKNASGVALSSKEKSVLKQKIDTTKGVMSWEQYFKSITGKYYPNFNGNEKKFSKMLLEDRKYISSPITKFNKDLQGLKLGVDSPELIGKAISMLENGEDVDLANSILDKYTLCTFKTAEEWREWYDTYKDDMFFSASGGWKYLVNTLEAYNPGNDYVAKQVDNVVKSMKFPELTPDTPVAVNAKIGCFDDGSEAIIFVFRVMKGFHIYAEVSDDDGYIPTQLSYSLAEGGKLGNVISPLDEYYSDSGTTQYIGDVVFVQYIDGDMKAGDIKINYSYQVCDEESCLPPVEEELIIKKLVPNDDK